MDDTQTRSIWFHFRPETWDELIFTSVVVRNEYRLPDALHPDDIIIDIGAHIGSFCYAALIRGSAHVHGFEAEAQNCRLARRNLRQFGDRVHIHHRAVWRSDRVGDTLFEPRYNGPNTGGGSPIYSQDGTTVEAIALDEVLCDITHNGQKRVRLLKVDCEGSEYPILLTSQWLHIVDSICGEFHEVTCAPVTARVEGMDHFTADVLFECLERQGFAVETSAHAGAIGNFFARLREGCESPSAAAVSASNRGPLRKSTTNPTSKSKYAQT